MRLDEVTSGSIYLDANVLYMYLRADPMHTPRIRTFLERVVRGELEAYASVLALEELVYRLLLARVKEATGLNPLDALRQDLSGAIAAHGGVIADAVRKLTDLPHMHIVPVESSALFEMLDNIRAYSLLPRDALHVATLHGLGLTAVASDDTDFDRVTGLDRHWLINPPAAVEK